MIDGFVGIDIGKFKFDVAVLSKHTTTKHRAFTNDQEGFEKLVAWLESDLSVFAAHFCMEATGRYGEQLAYFLFEQGHAVSVVNPTCIKNYGRSKLKRTKNDKIDAVLIATFCQRETPGLWQPLPEESRDLQEMSRELHRIKDLLAQEKTRLKSGTHVAAVLASIESRINFFEAQIQALESEIDVHIESNPKLRKQRKLLVSIPGIGQPTANALLGEIPDIHRFKGVRQLVAFAGLAPSERSSGMMKGQARLSKVGSTRIRKLLYFPAVSGKRYNPVIIDFCNRIESQGKSKMVALGGAMRKLLHIIYGVLKSGKPFNAKLHLQQA
ncbi:MAG: transposase [Candidatus Obscuribacterales bacterium]|nr:transposase [Candidatus Obscuribacterales bacterium]